MRKYARQLDTSSSSTTRSASKSSSSSTPVVFDFVSHIRSFNSEFSPQVDEDHREETSAGETSAGGCCASSFETEASSSTHGVEPSSSHTVGIRAAVQSFRCRHRIGSTRTMAIVGCASCAMLLGLLLLSARASGATSHQPTLLNQPPSDASHLPAALAPPSSSIPTGWPALSAPTPPPLPSARSPPPPSPPLPPPPPPPPPPSSEPSPPPSPPTPPPPVQVPPHPRAGFTGGCRHFAPRASLSEKLGCTLDMPCTTCNDCATTAAPTAPSGMRYPRDNGAPRRSAWGRVWEGA